jgi:transcriptional regulator with XRE-family HTH domain
VAKGFQDKRYRRLIEQLIAARKRAGLSQERAAGLLGTHQQFISRYETGERRLDAIELIDVARALGLDPVELIRQF